NCALSTSVEICRDMSTLLSSGSVETCLDMSRLKSLFSFTSPDMSRLVATGCGASFMELLLSSGTLPFYRTSLHACERYARSCGQGSEAFSVARTCARVGDAAAPL